MSQGSILSSSVVALRLRNCGIVHSCWGFTFVVRETTDAGDRSLSNNWLTHITSQFKAALRWDLGLLRCDISSAKPGTITPRTLVQVMLHRCHLFSDSGMAAVIRLRNTHNKPICILGTRSDRQPINLVTSASCSGSALSAGSTSSRDSGPDGGHR